MCDVILAFCRPLRSYMSFPHYPLFVIYCMYCISCVGFSLCGPPGANPQPPVYDNPHTPQPHLPSFPPTYSSTNGSSMMHSPSYTLPPGTPAANNYHKTMLMSGGMHLPPTPNDTSAEHPIHKLQQTSPFTPFGPLSLLSPRMPAQSAMLPQWPMNSPQSATLPNMHQAPLAGLTHADQRKDEPSSKSLSFGECSKTTAKSPNLGKASGNRFTYKLILPCKASPVMHNCTVGTRKLQKHNNT